MSLQALLEHGADVNKVDSQGCSPLLWSCMQGDEVRLIISCFFSKITCSLLMLFMLGPLCSSSPVRSRCKREVSISCLNAFLYCFPHDGDVVHDDLVVHDDDVGEDDDDDHYDKCYHFV
jgi:hypothetical protein